MTPGDSRGTALVTGATSGIGRELALELARRGNSLVLVARDAGRLDEVAAQARALGAPDARTLTADLLDPDDLGRVAAATSTVDVLVNAAGMGAKRAFPDAELADELAQIDLNIRALLVLCHAAARSMRTRGHGRILNVGSTAGIWSRGTYAGSKSWVDAATRGLAAACAPHGVSVTLLVPGFTRTEFHARSATATRGVPSWLWLDAARVARDGIDALHAGRQTCVPGRRYKALVAIASRLGPSGRQRLLSSLATLRPAT